MCIRDRASTARLPGTSNTPLSNRSLLPWGLLSAVRYSSGGVSVSNKRPFRNCRCKRKAACT
eukprot:15190616-Alexandrium_andersonii.AAC.1